MRFCFILILFSIRLSAVGAQSFEGRIIYENTFLSDDPNFSSDRMKSIVGSKQLYYIKGGNYKSVTDGNVVAANFYLARDNKTYAQLRQGKMIYWTDASFNKDDAVIRYEFFPNADTILGYDCTKLIMYSRRGMHTYYFSPLLPVDPHDFSAHRLGNWADYIALAKSLPLKTVIEENNLTIINEAIEVTSMTLDESFFEIPEGYEVVESPY